MADPNEVNDDLRQVKCSYCNNLVPYIESHPAELPFYPLRIIPICPACVSKKCVANEKDTKHVKSDSVNWELFTELVNVQHVQYNIVGDDCNLTLGNILSLDTLQKSYVISATQKRDNREFVIKRPDGIFVNFNAKFTAGKWEINIWYTNKGFNTFWTHCLSVERN